MLIAYRKKATQGIIGGWLFIAMGRVVHNQYDIIFTQLLGHFIILIGFIVWLWGCFAYARAKGYNRAWGVLGVLLFFGLLILYFFPDKHKDDKKSSNLSDVTQNT